MSCAQYQEQLPELLYEALDPSEVERLRAHLAGCAACGAEWGQLKATMALLERATPKDEPPAGMVDRAVAALEREQSTRLRWWARLDLWVQRISRHRPGRASWALASLMTVFLLIPVLYPNLVRFHSEGAGAACRTNLRVLASALDRFADDHQGRYPTSLNELVPRYVRKLPRCPVAGANTYSPGYKPAPNGLSFHLECAGHYHGSGPPVASEDGPVRAGARTPLPSTP